MIAFMLLVVAMGAEKEILGEIKKIDHVTDAVITYGSWDLVVRIEADDTKVIDETITRIRQIPKIEQSVTLIVM
ncbi:MAG: Lrp/AsnC ligand binding domain-containing protein [Candidatus Korarchaeota archaeon]